MAQLAANGTTLFNGIDASTAPLRYALRALASEPDFLAAPHQVIARLRPRVDAEKIFNELRRCWVPPPSSQKPIDRRIFN